MKKLLLLLAMCVLAAGCGAQSSSIGPEEPFDPAFAYVVAGYSGHIHNALWHNYNGQTDPFNVVGYRAYKNAYHTVYKVRPGNYFLRLVNVGNYSAQPSGPIQLASFKAEAGKINYLGQIDIKMQKMYNMSIFELSAEDKSEAAKAAIRKNYPALAGELDARFVYSPAVMGGLKK